MFELTLMIALFSAAFSQLLPHRPAQGARLDGDQSTGDARANPCRQHPGAPDAVRPRGPHPKREQHRSAAGTGWSSSGRLHIRPGVLG